MPMVASVSAEAAWSHYSQP